MYFKEREGTPAGGCESLRLPPSSAHFVTRANYPEPPERAGKDVCTPLVPATAY